MSIILKRYKLEEKLQRITAGEMQMTRETMIKIVESFDVWPGSPTFDEDFRKSYEWMEQCIQFAQPKWLEILRDILVNPPAYADEESFKGDFNWLMERVESLYSDKAQQVFGNDARYFDIPD